MKQSNPTLRLGMAAILAVTLGTGAAAAPRLTLDTVQAAPGALTAIALRLATPSAAYAGFNATVYLPAGVTLVGVTRGGLLPAPGFRLQTLPLADPTVNAVAILGYSESQTVSATGVLCTLTVQLAPGMGPGDYPIVVSTADRSPLVRNSHALSSSDGATSPAHTAGDGVLQVRVAGLPGDTNGNGIPDAWEWEHFNRITNVNDTTDFDGDGLSDYREYLSGTEPTNGLSCLAIVDAGIDRSPTGGVVLAWFGIPGCSYRVERAEADSPYGFGPIGMELPAVLPLNTYTDRTATADGPVYYRLQLTTP